MPQLGKIKRDWELGYAKHNRKYIWLACLGCGKERWVFLVNVTSKIPCHIYCLKCGVKYGKRPESRLGVNSPQWKGGRIMCNGYVKIWEPGHPRATKGNPYVSEHILVWEKVNNKCLPNGWVIHHLNGIRIDNRIENLVALSSKGHMKLIPEYRRRIRELEEGLILWKLGNSIS